MTLGVACVTDPETCGRSADCTAREVCSEIEAKVVSAVNGATLRDIVQRQRDWAVRGGQSHTT